MRYRWLFGLLMIAFAMVIRLYPHHLSLDLKRVIIRSVFCRLECIKGIGEKKALAIILARF